MIQSICSIVCRGLQNEMTFQALILRFLPHDPNHVYIGTDGVSNRLTDCIEWYLKYNEGVCIRGNSIRVHGLYFNCFKVYYPPFVLSNLSRWLHNGCTLHVYYFLIRKFWANSWKCRKIIATEFCVASCTDNKGRSYYLAGRSQGMRSNEGTIRPKAEGSRGGIRLSETALRAFWKKKRICFHILNFRLDFSLVKETTLFYQKVKREKLCYSRYSNLYQRA